MEKQMFVLSDLMEKEWDTGWHIVALTGHLAEGEEERSKMIGWDPKTEVAPSSRQRKKEKEKVSCWTGFVADGTKVLRVKEDEKNISDTKELFLQASIKNSKKVY